MDIDVVAYLEVEETFYWLDLLFLNVFAVWILLLLHSGQHLLPSFFVDLVHLVLDFGETTHDIVDRTDYLSYRLQQRTGSRLVGQLRRVISLEDGRNHENRSGLDIFFRVPDHQVELD